MEFLFVLPALLRLIVKLILRKPAKPVMKIEKMKSVESEEIFDHLFIESEQMPRVMWQIGKAA